MLIAIRSSHSAAWSTGTRSTSWWVRTNRSTTAGSSACTSDGSPGLGTTTSVSCSGSLVDQALQHRVVAAGSPG